jgi:hypothetical protein
MAREERRIESDAIIAKTRCTLAKVEKKVMLHSRDKCTEKECKN